MPGAIGADEGPDGRTGGGRFLAPPGMGFGRVGGCDGSMGIDEFWCWYCVRLLSLGGGRVTGSGNGTACQSKLVLVNDY